MGADIERERLRATFDQASVLYDAVRPTYPDALFDHLVEVTRLAPGDRLLEIGCGTGQATLPLVRRGFRITCVELGENLAAAARANLVAFPDADVVTGAFEQWQNHGQAFDLVYAATAWHWLDPATGYRKAWQALAPSGHLGLWSATHVFPEGGDPLFAEIQQVYEEIGQGLRPGERQPQPGQLAEQRAEIEASGLFSVVDVRHFDWETLHTADTYIDLLNTFSGHIAMQPWQRDRLYGEIRRRVAARDDPRVRRHWGAVLHIAQPTKRSGTRAGA